MRQFSRFFLLFRCVYSSLGNLRTEPDRRRTAGSRLYRGNIDRRPCQGPPFRRGKLRQRIARFADGAAS